MNLEEFKKHYMSHYVLLESDFSETVKFVSLSKDNFSTYSAVYLKQLLSICSEVDVLLSFLAKLYDNSCNDSGFGCSKILLNNEPNIVDLQIEVKNKDIILTPWKNEGIPPWWTAYNEIKHNRFSDALKFDSTKKYYHYANLENVINSLAALFSLELYAYRKLSQMEEKQQFVPIIKSIFTIKNSYWKDISVGSGTLFMDGCLYIDNECEFY